MAAHIRPPEDLQRQNQDQEDIVAERTREIRTAYDELKQAQAQLLQSEKLASIGQLAAGVAHEINNPVSFIISNLGTLGEYVRDLSSLLKSYGDLEMSVRTGKTAQGQATLDEIAQKKGDMDLEYILDDLDNLIAESADGASRVRRIVLSLKEFSHVDQEERQPTDLNNGLETTLNIVWTELKYKATVDKNYGEIPLVTCYPMELNQVFMNLLVNAVQAIEVQGTITIRTYEESGYVCVSISDTGTGMSPAVQKRIFEPFYTTKDVGKGTGLGLCMAYNIIVKKHEGQILVDSREGVGTTFTVKIPRE